MWVVKTTDRFDTWFEAQSDRDRANVLAAMLLLRDRGPRLIRPYADFVKGSRFGNMKEMRIQSQGRPIRAMFAFDPKRGRSFCAQATNRRTLNASIEKWWPLLTTSLLAILLG